MVIKKFFYLAIGLIVMFFSGLLLASIDWIGKYEIAHARLTELRGKLTNAYSVARLLEKQLGSQEKRMQKLRFLEFKADTFDKKFPEFSHIIDTVYRESPAYGFNPSLVLAMIQVESGFKPNAVSVAGAYGLMQVHYSVWKEALHIDQRLIFDPDYNIRLGLEILRRYFRVANGNLDQALYLYNNGYKYGNLEYGKKVQTSIFCYNQNDKTDISLTERP